MTRAIAVSHAGPRIVESHADLHRGLLEAVEPGLGPQHIRDGAGLADHPPGQKVRSRHLRMRGVALKR